MPNVYANTNWVAMESLRILKNKLELSQFFNTDYAKEYKQRFAVGSTVQVKFPQRFLIRDGLAYSAQPINRRTAPVTMDQVFGIDFEWDSVEKALNLERPDSAITREYIDPAMSQLAQEIDSRCALWAKNHTPNVTGALGTTPTALSTYLTANQRQFELACPPGAKGMVVSPGMMATIAGQLTTITNAGPMDEISRMFKQGAVMRAAGFEWYQSMSLYSHTAGTWDGAVTITSDIADGASSIGVTCTTGDTFKKGDKINIAAVNAVNPQTRRSIGSLKQFVITEDATGAASAATLQISPTIYGPGSQYQNVDALPLAAAALTLWPGTTSPSGKSGIVGQAIHRDAFAMVASELEVPQNAEAAWQRRDPETGISIRFVRDWHQESSKMLNRFDVFIGFGNFYNDSCAVAVASLI